MTGKEVRALSPEEIGVELKRLRDKLYSLRTQAVTEKVEDNSQFRKVRRDIARLMTEHNSRNRGEAKPRQHAPKGETKPAAKAGKKKVGAKKTTAKIKTASKTKGKTKAGASKE